MPLHVTALLLMIWFASGCATAPVDVDPGIDPVTSDAGDSEPPGTWVRRPSLATGVIGARASVVGADLWVVGGFTSLGGVTRSIQVFDGDSWNESLIRLNEARAFHGQVILKDGRVLVAGGQSGAAYQSTALASTEVFDPVQGITVPGPDLPDPIRTPTIHRLPDGRVVIVGGKTATVLDVLGERVTRVMSLREPRRSHASVMLADGRIVVVGGFSDRIEIINPTTGLSQLLDARLPLALDDLAVVLMADGRLWVLGGQDSRSGDTTDRSWFVDLLADAIVEGPGLGMALGVADGILVNTSAGCWLIGGESQDRGRDIELRSVLELDLDEGRILPWSLLKHDHDDATAVFWREQIWVIGGLSYRDLLFRHVPYANDVVESTTIERE